MLFSNAILDFKGWKSFEIKAHTAKGIEYNLRSFCLFLKDPELNTVSWNDIKEYLDIMKKLGWDHNTFVHKLEDFRAFFSYWHERDKTVLNPNWIPKMEWIPKTPRVIDEENYKKIISVIGKTTSDLRNLVFINLLWDTGARRGEVLSLNINDLDLVNKKATIKTEKTNKFRQIFWTEETNDHIKNWLTLREKWEARGRVKDPEAVFISTKGQHTGKRAGKDCANAMLKEYCLKAGIEVFNPHSFRHHMGRYIIERMGSNSDVAGILGHTNLASTYIYTQLSDKRLEQRYRQFKGN